MGRSISTYQASAAKPSVSEVSSAAGRSWAARVEFAADWTAKHDPTRWAKAEGHDGAPVESTAREACQPPAQRPRRAASESFSRWHWHPGETRQRWKTLQQCS